jgi:pyruvate kinase
VFESADALVLGEETATGSFPVDAITTMASIIRNAEEATHYYALHSYSRDFSAKPFTSCQAPAYSLARMAFDATISAVVTFTMDGEPAQIVSKFRPPVPHIVATANKSLASMANLCFGIFAVVLPSAKGQVHEMLRFVLKVAKEHGLYTTGDVGVLHGHGSVLFADQDSVVSIMQM